MKGFKISGAAGSPWLPVVLLLAFLPARWLGIAGIGEFPNDYVFASRLALGQFQGADFSYIHATALPFYPAAFWLKVFSGGFIGINVNVWIWWLLNVLAAGWLVRKAKGKDEEVAFSMLLVALLFVPPNTNLVSWHFSASVLSTLAVGCFVSSLDGNRARWLAAAGLACGVNSLVKANVGVGTLVALILAVLVHGFLSRSPWISLLQGEAALTLGYLPGFFIPLGALGYFGGIGNVFVEGFLSAGQVKGGPHLWLLRALPRISLVLDPVWKYFVEVLVVAPVFAAIFWISWRLWNKDQEAQGREAPQKSKIAMSSWAVFAVVAALSLWSLQEADFPRRLNLFFRGLGLISLPEFNNHLLYVAVYAVLASYLLFQCRNIVKRAPSGSLWNSRENKVLFLLGGVSLLLLMANGASGRYGTAYAAGLFVPFAVLSILRRPSKVGGKVLVGIVLYWTVSWNAAPTWPSTFGRLVKFPGDSIFHGLYHLAEGPAMPGSYLRFSAVGIFEGLQKNVAPLVRGKSTLWVNVPLEGAYGDLPFRYGLVPMTTGHTSRNESKLVSDLQETPPEYIVADRLNLWDVLPDALENSFFRSRTFVPWLERRYVPVWKSSNGADPIALWKRKAAPGSGQGGPG